MTNLISRLRKINFLLPSLSSALTELKLAEKNSQSANNYLLTASIINIFFSISLVLSKSMYLFPIVLITVSSVFYFMFRKLCANSDYYKLEKSLTQELSTHFANKDNLLNFFKFLETKPNIKSKFNLSDLFQKSFIHIEQNEFDKNLENLLVLFEDLTEFYPLDKNNDYSTKIEDFLKERDFSFKEDNDKATPPEVKQGDITQNNQPTVEASYLYQK